MADKETVGDIEDGGTIDNEKELEHEDLLIKDQEEDAEDNEEEEQVKQDKVSCFDTQFIPFNFAV
ncbi:MAG: hypothetical protein EZS28_056695, partial [Streblomastix strix]